MPRIEENELNRYKSSSECSEQEANEAADGNAAAAAAMDDKDTTTGAIAGQPVGIGSIVDAEVDKSEEKYC